MKIHPKISIITVSFNQGSFIEQTIRSVLEQTYPNIEYLVVDGGSTDGSVEIIKKYADWLTYWVSEPDEGQSHAYNKGLSKATGEYLLCLNSDDFLLTPDIIAKIVDYLEEVREDDYSAFMGNIIYVDDKGNRIGDGTNLGLEYDFSTLLNHVPMVIHPATLFRVDIIRLVRGFSRDVHYQMDYDIFLKIAKIKPIISMPFFVSALRRHEASKGGGTQSWQFCWEFVKVRQRHGGRLFSRINLVPGKRLLYKLVGETLISRLAGMPGVQRVSRRTGWHNIRSANWIRRDNL
jgi:glycosyltransferase involved in cell wall biosynthesis